MAVGTILKSLSSVHNSRYSLIYIYNMLFKKLYKVELNVRTFEFIKRQIILSQQHRVIEMQFVIKD